MKKGLFAAAVLAVGMMMTNCGTSGHLTANQFEYIKEKRGNYEVDIEWPLSLKGMSDIKNLQLAIVQDAFNHNSINIHDCVENYFNEEKISLGDYGTSGIIIVKYQMTLNDLYIFNIREFIDAGGGTTMSNIFRGMYLYYDKNTDKPLRLNDIITDYSEALSIVNQHIPDRYRQADELPDNFILSASGIEFIFPKYSIGCGADDAVSISVTYDDLKPVLSKVFKDAMKM